MGISVHASYNSYTIAFSRQILEVQLLAGPKCKHILHLYVQWQSALQKVYNTDPANHRAPEVLALPTPPCWALQSPTVCFHLYMRDNKQVVNTFRSHRWILFIGVFIMHTFYCIIKQQFLKTISDLYDTHGKILLPQALKNEYFQLISLFWTFLSAETALRIWWNQNDQNNSLKCKHSKENFRQFKNSLTRCVIMHKSYFVYLCFSAN